MAAARDLGEQRRGPVELSGLGQELDDRVPARRLGDRHRDGPRHQLGGPARMARPPMGEDGGPHVGERRLHLERLEVVEQQLRILGPIVRTAAADHPVAELGEKGTELAVDPAPGRGAALEAVLEPAEEAGAAEKLTGRAVRRAEIGIHERVERALELDEALERAKPVVDTAALVVPGGREAEPVALAMLAPILTGDLVLHDPAPLGRRPGQEDLDRDAEAGDAPPLRLVPAARRWGRAPAAAGEPAAAPRGCRAAMAR